MKRRRLTSFRACPRGNNCATCHVWIPGFAGEAAGVVVTVLGDRMHVACRKGIEATAARFCTETIARAWPSFACVELARSAREAKSWRRCELDECRRVFEDENVRRRFCSRACSQRSKYLAFYQPTSRGRYSRRKRLTCTEKAV